MTRKHKSRAAGRPPDGEPWVWHTLGLLSSAAWRGRSINCTRLIDFLEIEHLQHGGNENGSLLAPCGQLVTFGITRRLIAETIRESERLGLARVERGGKKGSTMTELSRYRLTYLWTKTRTSGLWNWHPPSDEWKHFEAASIGPTSGTVVAPLREPVPAPLREPPPSQTLENAKGHVVPIREPPSKSWGGDWKDGVQHQPSTSPPSMEARAQRAAQERRSKPARLPQPIGTTSTAPGAALRNAKPLMQSSQEKKDT